MPAVPRGCVPAWSPLCLSPDGSLPLCSPSCASLEGVLRCPTRAIRNLKRREELRLDNCAPGLGFLPETLLPSPT